MCGAIIESSVTVAFAEKEDRSHPLEKAEKGWRRIFEKAGFCSLEEARKCRQRSWCALRDVLLGPGIHFEPAIDGSIPIQESNFDAYKRTIIIKSRCWQVITGEAGRLFQSLRQNHRYPWPDCGVCRRFWRKGGGIRENQPGGK